MGTPEARQWRAIGQSLLFAAGFLVLVAISATSVILVDQAREDNAWVVHTLEVENQISTLLLRIRTAESAVRGYVLTGEQRFLTEHEAAIADRVPCFDDARVALEHCLIVRQCLLNLHAAQIGLGQQKARLDRLRRLRHQAMQLMSRTRVVVLDQIHDVVG